MIKAIDFFCGAGGLTRGLLDAGISVVGGVDNDTRQRETYSRNNAPSVFIDKDIGNVEIDDLRNELGIVPSDVVLYAACTPCQPFSTLNAMKGDDDRKSLLMDFAQIVAERPPDFIIVENVPGLNNARGREIYQQFAETLKNRKFAISADMLDAKYLGAPQTRKRFILIASRHGEPSLPTPDGSAEVKTVASAIAKYPAIADGEKSDAYPNHEAKKLQPHHKKIVMAVPKDGGSRSDVADTSILLKCHQRNPKAHKDVFGRMAWNKPSLTLTCRCTDVYCGRFTHPEQHRGISLREAAALQTFPDDYEFFGKSFLEKSRQIGNAVPVEVGRRLGESIIASTGGE